MIDAGTTEPGGTASVATIARDLDELRGRATDTLVQFHVAKAREYTRQAAADAAVADVRASELRAAGRALSEAIDACSNPPVRDTACELRDRVEDALGGVGL